MSYIGNSPTQTAFVTDLFNGDNSTTAFTMSVSPANPASILVAVSGVLQSPDTYSVSGQTLNFSAAPPSATGNISVRYLGIPASGVTTTAYRTITEYTATAGQTTFTPPSYTVGFINVFRNGVMLGTADYTASNGTSVVLTNACTSGDLVVIESFYVSSVLNAIPNTAGAVTSLNIQSGVTLTSPIIIGSTPQITTYTSGSGTYTVPTNARFLLIKMAGAGGGGGGSGAGSGGGGAGGTGGTTTFGSSLLTCTGGTGGVWGGAGTAGGDGGTATIGSGASGVAVTGNAGNQYPGGYNSTNVYTAGSLGGTSPLGKSGYGSSSNGAGGQGGGSSGTSIVVGTGGGAGGYIEAYVSPLSATYAYSIGAGGTAGTAGTSGFAGIVGGNGIIFITAFF